MDRELLKKLSSVTEEERRILAGQTQIDRSLYMDGTRDVISGDKLLPQGKSSIFSHASASVFQLLRRPLPDDARGGRG